MSVLVVVAHPDDEVLGCGGTAYSWTQRGTEVTACLMSAGAEARNNRPETPRLRNHVLAAADRLGMEEPIYGEFPNIEMNTVPHLEVVQFIEDAIRKTQAEVIITHHPGDVNDDHRVTSMACQAAARLNQRQPDQASPLRALLFAEILSSTDWAYPGAGASFEPTAYVEIGEEGLAAKREALAAYQGVMRPYPHPRSDEALTGLATLRGAAAGVRYAESFQVATIDVANLADGRS